MDELLSLLQSEGLLVLSEGLEDNGCSVSYITADSRKVVPGTLFVCKGFAFKQEYLVMSVKSGACVYMSEVKYDVDIPCIIVTDVRKASSIAARWFFDYPGDAMNITGITGTKGKTTTAYILKAILDTHKEKTTAIFSTMETDTVKTRKISHLTTPEPIDLQELYKEALDYGVENVVMEVSSQAVKMSRVFGQRFRTGIFLNIGEDHIGDKEHESMEDYVSCKTRFLKQCETVIIYRGTEYFEEAYNAAADAKKTIVYGFSEDCNAVINDLHSGIDGVSFKLSYNGSVEEYSSNLIGAFNAENITAAILAAYELGIDADTIRRGIANIHISGRMVLINYNDINIIVDYAHNYLSFVKLYETVKASFKPNKIHAVFGVPGERSAVRKRDLGIAAQEYADYVYLTADDPGFEDVNDLCMQMKAYISKPCVIIEDREEAVRTALNNAKPHDVVILAGKGAEVTQRVNGGYVPYPSDQKVAELWISEQSNGEENE